MGRGGARGRRVGEQLRRELAELLQRELRDPRVGRVTLTGVDMSPDYAHASVYFTCLDPALAPQAAAGLARAAGFLRAQLARRIRLHVTPELHFRHDESVERGERLSRLIDAAAKSG
jgi:ribosome-binding factor A